MFTCRLPWWTSSAACKLWQPPRFLPGVWEKCQLPSCKGINTTVGQGQQVDAQEKQVLEDLEMPLAKREMETLFQEQPETGNQYLEDALLRSYLKTHLPPKVLEEVNQDLERFGNRLLTKIKPLGWECELNPPVFRQYDAWGQRVDQIVTCSAWRRMKEIAAEEGLIAEAYERRYSSWSRLHQAVKLYLFSSFSGGFSCPLAMTDGAAKVIESLGFPVSLKSAFDHLTSRDPKKFWTSGQWMTERRGGSDVANGTETVARKQPDGTYRLYGFKWFTSAADSDVTLTLARVVDAEGKWPQGSSGLSLFFLKVRDEEGKLNSIQVQRLKDKLGTRQMATAELWLDGAKAELISAEGRGVASISNMLNITRIHNVICAVASMRRMISLSREYARRRVAFGKCLKDHPLHMQTIARMEVQTRGAFLLFMEIVRLLGLVETNMASEQDQLLLRLLIPVAKLYTGKQASAVVVEAMESFGGQGYMEDTGLPVIVRDTLVLSIWEGTTNILSLDVLRSLTKSQGQVMAVFLSAVQKKLELASSTMKLEPAVKQMRDAISSLVQFTRAAGSKGAATMELAARDFSYTLARTYAGALLIEHAARPDASSTDISAARRWCNQELCPVATELENSSYEAEEALMDHALVYEGSPAGRSRL
ncbi:acyl-CoA dehydrogenase family member 11-like [Falco naumanni]|uniref:acyl-CoA dehydrogenase family member 11-like n=1 Tax=Falco naumanni TaxID=148594 RepID=UPI001ADE87B8|nr:acyl-CoA dehydrogenase family member 11-like [Falco naumanni]XP_040462889.1 acyl-CoA dehydrogenase family member 11-like [Falco naumanni]XP_040462900.1 acyl-CoA dehydrogenase family member 11-like [Falco naumanni]XP_040462909.1 acyl-CoA dehydrogenase family member 11-like [Falco naumanni]XP_040462916.1 acyl-CoA dehydrogenase family member 11-like [Falco naumanni]